MKRLFFSVCGLCTFLWVAGCAQAQPLHVYSNDFETGHIDGWTTDVTNPKWQQPVEISTTPDGVQRFLGEFGNQSVHLALNNLPAHDSITISFDLFILRSWDGNTDPDLWLFSVDDSLMMRTTFSNVTYPQAFPGTYPNTRADARMGAVANNSLGFIWSEPNVYTGPLDSYYRLSFSLPHTAALLTLDFAAQLKDARPVMSNESWALDNVSVQAAPHVQQKPELPRMTGSEAEHPQVDSIPTYDLSDVVITMQRGACFGHCPIYTVTIYGNGKIEFQGDRFVDNVGFYVDSIAVDDVKKLVHAFHTSGFFSMKDEYTNPRITDLPSVRTTFSGNGVLKSIRDYFGAPQELKALEKLVDSIAQTRQWIKGANE